MKLTDYIIAVAIALLIGLGAYLGLNQLLGDDHFKTSIEIVKPIDDNLKPDSTDIFSNGSRVDFSSPVKHNTVRNPQPFTSKN